MVVKACEERLVLIGRAPTKRSNRRLSAGADAVRAFRMHQRVPDSHTILNTALCVLSLTTHTSIFSTILLSQPFCTRSLRSTEYSMT